MSSSNWRSLETLVRASAKSSTTSTRIFATMPHHAPCAAALNLVSRLLAPIQAKALADVLNRERLGRLHLGVRRRAQHEVHVRLAERHDVLEPLELQRRLAVHDERQVLVFLAPLLRLL